MAMNGSVIKCMVKKLLLILSFLILLSSVIYSISKSDDKNCDQLNADNPLGIAKDLQTVYNHPLLYDLTVRPTVNFEIYSLHSHLDATGDGLICVPYPNQLNTSPVERINFRAELNLIYDIDRKLRLVDILNFSELDEYLEVNTLKSEIKSAYLFESNLTFNLKNFPILLEGHQTSNKNCWLIYHAGHGTQLDGAEILIEETLKNGCRVFLLEMPVSGPLTPRGNRNTRYILLPLNSLDMNFLDLSSTRFNLHEGFSVLETILGRHALDTFLQPTVDTLNYIDNVDKNAHIVMAGLSGGGWTTHLMAAADERIKHSVAVAGSEPLESFAYDYEQSHLTILSSGGYSKIYKLASASSEGNRTHFHILNKFDTCCFRPRSRLDSWEESINRTNYFGVSNYRLFIDESGNGHAIHSDATAVILDLLSNIDQKRLFAKIK